MVIKERASVSYSEPDESIAQLPIYFFQIHFFITFPVYTCVFEVGWLRQIFWPTLAGISVVWHLCYKPCLSSFLLLDLIIVMFFVEEYQLQTCFYAIFFSILLLSPSQVQMFSLACCFKALPASFDTVMWETKFYSHIKRKARYCAFSYLYCTVIYLFSLHKVS